METEQNFSMMTLAKYWPDLSPEEREAALTASGLPLELQGILLAQVNFGTAAKAFQAEGISRDDERLYDLAIMVSEQGSKRFPRCPGCGHAMIVIEGEGNYCPQCDCT